MDTSLTLPQSLLEPSLAPCHAEFRHFYVGYAVIVLRSAAQFRV